MARSSLLSRARLAALESVVARRDVLKVGPIALSASVLPALFHSTAAAESFRPDPNAKAKSIIYLWMGGGVTHIDSLDPKPLAPEAVRGTLGAIRTSLPGVYFNEVCPNLARIAQDLCVVRSFSHDSNDHLMSQVYTLSGRKVTPAELFKHPNIGSIVQHLLGSRNGMPGYIAVPGITRPGPPPHNLFVGGWLGGQYAPFCVGGQPEQPDFTVGEKSYNPHPEAFEDLNPRELRFPDGVTLGRIERRANLRETLEKTLSTAENANRLTAMNGHYEGALNLLASPKVRNAFDITQESPETRDSYGRTKIGGRCLLARRLVEAGSRFVMVDYGYDPDYGNLWDIHNVAEQRFPHVSEMCRRGYNVAGMEQAFAALVTDLKQRGLLESTLVVYLTEFGRTPKINTLGGRDHWGACGSMFFAGAGVQAGKVVGETDSQAAYPLTQPYGPADIAATMYTALGIDPEHRVYDIQHRPVPVLDHGVPIAEVLS
ncbi:MAG: DUF1501 domain-containing protein [Planctomycetaceae bacterium]|nr:DUF1501 domain-containing protein [Planctomycetaceae bacterium]